MNTRCKPLSNFTAVLVGAVARWVLCVLGLASLTNCANHIRSDEPRVRKYKAAEYDKVADGRADGSLWNESADTLFTFRRAARVGDLITVQITESSNATRNAATELSKSGSLSAQIDAIAGSSKLGGIDVSKLLSLMHKNEFSGKGQTQRSGTLAATLTVRIKKILQNGDFYVEGEKVVLINDEESHLYLSGVIRPADVQADNSVFSENLADVQIEYTGRGVVAEQQHQGWLSRVWNWINPL